MWQSAEERQQLTLTFPGPLPMPHATIALHFNYTLSEALEGFYRSTYTGAVRHQ